MLNKYQKLAHTLAMKGQNLSVAANPGTGKTHLGREIALSLAENGKRVLYAAFANTNVDDIKSKVNHDNVTISTVHSACLKQHGYNANIQDGRLLFRLRMDKISALQIPFILNLVALAKAHGLKAATMDQMAQIAKHYSVFYGYFSLPHEQENEVLGLACNYLQDIATDSIDYDDMVFHVAVELVKVKTKWDVIIIDEYQDMSRSQIIALALMADQLIGLGQDEQGIYGFRGAAGILPLPDETIVKLKETYRCHKPIVDFVNGIFETDMVAVENDPSSKVEIIEQLAENHILTIDTDTMVVTRTNREVVKMAITCLLNKRPFRLSNPDIMLPFIALCYDAAYQFKCPKCGKELNAFKGKYGWAFGCKGTEGNPHKQEWFNIKKIETTTKELAIAWLKVYYESVIEQSRFPVDKIEERDLLVGLFESAQSPKQAIYYLWQIIYEQNENGALLTTAHKCKGLEAESVIVIGKNFFNDFVKTGFQQRQEYNLLFVAYTRAKKQLTIVGEPYIEQLTEIRTKNIR